MAKIPDISLSRPAVTLVKDLRSLLPRKKPELKHIEYDYESLTEKLQDEAKQASIWDLIALIIDKPVEFIKLVVFIIRIFTKGGSMFASIFKNWRTSLGGLIVALAVFFKDYLTNGQQFDLWTVLISVGIFAVGAFLPDLTFLKTLLEKLLEEHKSKLK